MSEFTPADLGTDADDLPLEEKVEDTLALVLETNTQRNYDPELLALANHVARLAAKLTMNPDDQSLFEEWQAADQELKRLDPTS